MNSSMNPLSQLRDIHLPQAVGFWPIAIGWYVLALLVLVFASVMAMLWRKRQARLAPKRAALAQLARLKKRYQQDQDPVEAAIELSMLFRRVALVLFPSKKVASLRDREWLSFLDRVGNTSEFSQGVGQALITAPYQRRAQYDVEQLFVLADSWIHHSLSLRHVSS